MRTRLIGVFALALMLAACGEKDQSLAKSGSKSDGKPWEGTQGSFIDKGWTPGDKARWETHLRTRAQQQNEYVKVN